MNIIIECIGYVGMIIVITSFLFKNIKWIRVVNIIGSIISAIYGILTKTYPTAILNTILIFVNTTMLIKFNKYKREHDES